MNNPEDGYQTCRPYGGTLKNYFEHDKSRIVYHGTRLCKWFPIYEQSIYFSEKYNEGTLYISYVNQLCQCSMKMLKIFNIVLNVIVHVYQLDVIQLIIANCKMHYIKK